jgi:osmotically-inducible protein OsmY
MNSNENSLRAESTSCGTQNRPAILSMNSFSNSARANIRRNIKPYGWLIAFPALLLLGTFAAWPAIYKSPDVRDAVRRSLDQAGFENISISQNRNKGVVILRGTVPSDNEKERAASATRSVATGQVVSDRITVSPHGRDGDANALNEDLDKDIEKDLETALFEHNLHKAVKYDVSKGIVTLTGKVSSNTKRAQAEKVASGVPNVQRVVNELQVKGYKPSSSR